MENQPIVDVRAVHKVYQRGGEKLDVLKGVSLQVPKGEFLALMGPSGSGKTTLLNLMAGIDNPTAGEVIINGQNLSRLSEDLARLVSEEARPAGLPNSRTIRRRGGAVLEGSGLLVAFPLRHVGA